MKAECGMRNAEWKTVTLGDVADVNPAWLDDCIDVDEEVAFVPMAAVSAVIMGSSLDDPYVKDILKISKEVRERIEPFSSRKPRRVIILEAPTQSRETQHLEPYKPERASTNRMASLSNFIAEYGFDVWTYDREGATSFPHANLYYFLEAARKISPITSKDPFSVTNKF